MQWKRRRTSSSKQIPSNDWFMLVNRASRCKDTAAQWINREGIRVAYIRFSLVYLSIREKYFSLTNKSPIHIHIWSVVASVPIRVCNRQWQRNSNGFGVEAPGLASLGKRHMKAFNPYYVWKISKLSLEKRVVQYRSPEPICATILTTETVYNPLARQPEVVKDLI